MECMQCLLVLSSVGNGVHVLSFALSSGGNGVHTVSFGFKLLRKWSACSVFPIGMECMQCLLPPGLSGQSQNGVHAVSFGVVLLSKLSP